MISAILPPSLADADGDGDTTKFLVASAGLFETVAGIVAGAAIGSTLTGYVDGTCGEPRRAGNAGSDAADGAHRQSISKFRLSTSRLIRFFGCFHCNK